VRCRELSAALPFELRPVPQDVRFVLDRHATDHSMLGQEDIADLLYQVAGFPRDAAPALDGSRQRFDPVEGGGDLRFVESEHDTLRHHGRHDLQPFR